MDKESLNELRLNTKLWLKAKGYDYAWLADRCYVSEATVRNWMSRRDIPLSKRDIIRRLMSQDSGSVSGAPIEVEAETHVSIKLPSEFCKNIEMKAKQQHLCLEAFIIQALNDLCRP